MLKHKIRKSRKNILSLLESVQVEEDKQSPEYTKVNKRDKREVDIGRKLSVIDEGYYTGNEKLYDVPHITKERARSEGRTRRREEEDVEIGDRRQERRKPVRNETVRDAETSTGTNITSTGGQYGCLVPVFMAWQPPRRSSPQEDFIFTLTGVRNLIHQQSLLLTELQSNLYTTSGADTKDDTMEDVNTVEEISPATAKTASSGNLSKSSSSMKTLRRIMEIEELVTFSQALDRRLTKSDKNKC